MAPLRAYDEHLLPEHEEGVSKTAYICRRCGIKTKEALARWKWGFKYMPSERHMVGRSAAAKNNAWFTVWRLVAAAYMTAVMLLSIVDGCNTGDISIWYIWLTNWSLVIEVVYLWLAFAMTLNHRRRAAIEATERRMSENASSAAAAGISTEKAKYFEPEMPPARAPAFGVSTDFEAAVAAAGAHSSQLQHQQQPLELQEQQEQVVVAPPFVCTVWFFQNVSYVLAMAVAVLYWSLVYSSSSGESISYLETQVHGTNALIVLIDAFFSAGPPFRLLHVWQPFLVGLAWVIFSIFQGELGFAEYNGNDFIYPLIEWYHFWRTLGIVALIVFVVLPIFHLTVWMVWHVGTRATHARERLDGNDQAKNSSASTSTGGDRPGVALGGTRNYDVTYAF